MQQEGGRHDGGGDCATIVEQKPKESLWDKGKRTESGWTRSRRSVIEACYLKRTKIGSLLKEKSQKEEGENAPSVSTMRLG